MSDDEPLTKVIDTQVSLMPSFFGLNLFKVLFMTLWACVTLVTMLVFFSYWYLVVLTSVLAFIGLVIAVAMSPGHLTYPQYIYRRLEQRLEPQVHVKSSKGKHR